MDAQIISHESRLFRLSRLCWKRKEHVKMFIMYHESSWCIMITPDVMLHVATGPLTQATGPPQSDAGVGIGMLRGIPLLSAN